MLLGIEIPEREYLQMSDEEKLALLQDAYNRTKSLKYQAMSYLERTSILPTVVLTDRQERLVEAYVRGYLGIRERRKDYAYDSRSE